MSEKPEFVMEREFDAPRELVWRAWTEPEFLARWYGPNVETVIHEFDLKPGGQWLHEMKMGENSHFVKIEFQEIQPPERISWLESGVDSNWNNAPNPMMPDWPGTLSTTVTFEDAGEKTNMRFVWAPHEATDAQVAAFVGAKDNLGGGWGSGFGIMDEILAELQA
ncbi:MAG: SRPBCC domain-containing protein [Chloroflexi bacterium]|nr:SRPBCC domain-containing protein [Chloroflexota bacterium]MBT4074397.1 SRPBCC domain-containing protein [Chloroflexota bacterium]MBT4513697.1 SRPBCC domain-containing protein [Chloroflexota bacterium]MBT6682710.1 SRPBCC domain-containing protein [Chloroflexota bacterium]